MHTKNLAYQETPQESLSEDINYSIAKVAGEVNTNQSSNYLKCTILKAFIASFQLSLYPEFHDVCMSDCNTCNYSMQIFPMHMN